MNAQDATRETKIQELRGDLSIARSRIRQLEGENAALSARAALAVTQEADVRQVARMREYETQLCYRCDHPLGASDADCKCCEHGHTPDGDGLYDGKSLEEWREQ